ncbi:Blue copper protein [Forsythia ovata]|uniref:Blue copper protein n=1 Tax=Forsythia ovata TaxID=205694 RepID=A0ABD1SJ16_9LAMI
MGKNINFAIIFAILVASYAVIEKGDAATYIVGDSVGWTIPTGGASFYTNWASQHVFRSGDILVFNFTTGFHDVAKVSKAAYDGCSSNSPISLITLGPANVTLDSTGNHRCTSSVTIATRAWVHSASPRRQNTNVLSGSRWGKEGEVGDALGWLVPPGGDAAYRTWASTKTFTVGDVLVFNFTTGIHDVAEVNKAGFDSCSGTSPISISTNGPTNITLRSAGEHFFICTIPRHCDAGQKLAINVLASSTSPAPQPATPPPETTPSPVATPAPSPSPVAKPAPSPSRPPMTYTVGDSLGWVVPPGGPIAYETWARGKNFIVGDILVFNFTSGAHNVAEVRKAGFDSCNGSAAITTTTTSPARITLSTAGEHFYICTFPQHCSFGQKLAINVTRTNAPTRPTPPSSPAPTPSSTATPPPSTTTPSPSSGTPSTPTTPSPVTGPPPPDSSASSFGVAALPFSLLSIALAFLY